MFYACTVVFFEFQALLVHKNCLIHIQILFYILVCKYFQRLLDFYCNIV